MFNSRSIYIDKIEQSNSRDALGKKRPGRA